MSIPVTAEKQAPKFVEVALPLPIRRVFTYSLPEQMRADIQLGARLVLPFGKRTITGYAVQLHSEVPVELDIDETKIKAAVELVDDEPLVTPEILELSKWTADYYLASWGEVLRASLPGGVNAETQKLFAITEKGRVADPGRLGRPDSSKRSILAFLAENGDSTRRRLDTRFGKAKVGRAIKELIQEGFVEANSKTYAAKARPKRRKAVRLIEQTSVSNTGKPLTDAQTRIIETLQVNDGQLLFTELLEKACVGGSSIATLAKRGLLEIYVHEVRRDPLASAELPQIADLTLTKEQAHALTEIGAALDAADYKGFLLHGITGSGKTEIYIRAMRAALDRGRSALMLVPEIALTPLFSRRLKAVFGDGVAILHSNLSTGERYDEWRRIRRGSARIVIGTRSAVFAPLVNIGLIIVDEEHDSSYRQNESPFYNARDVAIMRANLAGAVAVLGSATPALESFHNAQIGKYEYLQLPNRIAMRPLAQAELIDMRDVFAAAGKDVTLSPVLIEAITETHARGEQSMVLLNRRGFSQFVLCRTCGESIKCRNCDITLTYHKREARLMCHYCNYQVGVPDKCPFCASEFLYFIGEGTEQLEDILGRKFPGLRIARIDRDTAGTRHAMERTLLAFDRGEIDMLAGTQMIAKGHDFPNVTLVGVISVDLGLGLPDFRSAERTFQLLTQVAGRAGRGDRPGRVMIQTYYPEHYALRHACRQDYQGFYADEIRFRQRMGFPPFFVLASIMIRHKDEKTALANARILKRCLDQANVENACRISGVAQASLPRLRGEYRLQILIRSTSRKHLRETLETALSAAESMNCDMRVLSVEIDPINML